jgi:hypothetical protein
MSNRIKDVGWRPLITSVPSIVANYAHGLLSFEGRAVFRQNAIRKAIASLIETERMRLATTIGNRDHN